MADLKSFELDHLIGFHTDDTDRKAGGGGNMRFVAVSPGGVQIEGSRQSIDIPTEHGVEGTRYSVSGTRNTEAGTLTVPLKPGEASLINLAGTAPEAQTAGGDSKFFQIDRYGFRNLGTTKSGNASADLGERRVGCRATGFGVNIDREAEGAIDLSINLVATADLAIPAGSLTQDGSTVTAGADKTVTMTATATGWRSGDYAQITDGGVTSYAYVTAVDGADVTFDQLTYDLDGGAAIVKVDPRGYAPVTPAVSTTSSTAITVGADKVISVASAAGLAVGDLIRIRQGATRYIATISVIAGTDVTIHHAPIATTGTVAVEKVEPKRAYTDNYVYEPSQVFVRAETDRGYTISDDDITAVSMDYDAALTPSAGIADAEQEFNGAWSKLTKGTSTATGSMTVTVAEDAYPDLKRGATAATMDLTVMVVSGAAPGDTVTDTTETAGTSVEIGVADESGFRVGNYVLIEAAAGPSTAKVTAVATGSITVDELRDDLATGVRIRNTVAGFRARTVEITAAPLTAADQTYTQELALTVRTDADTEKFLETYGYDEEALFTALV